VNSVLYEAAPTLDGLVDALEAGITTVPGLHVDTDTGTWSGSQIILEVVTGPSPSSIHISGDDFAVVGVQATYIMGNRKASRLLGDKGRTVLIGLDRFGARLHAVTITGGALFDATTQGDGHVGDDGSWVETFDFTITGVTPPP